MKEIRLHDKTFESFISEEKLSEMVLQMAKDIEQDLDGVSPVCLGILNGSFRILADLYKHWDMPCKVEFIKLSSYQSDASTGKITQLLGLRESLKGQTVLLVEDIIDTGLTLANAVNAILAHEPKELKVATLFLKPDIYKGALVPDYVGAEIPNDFIVGYGMDYDGLGRNLNAIYKLKQQ